jgi:endonuclease YncB( thermonuclease family)
MIRAIHRTAALYLAIGLASCTTAPSSRPMRTPNPIIHSTSATLAASAAPVPLPATHDVDQQPALVGTVLKVIDGDTIQVQLSSGPISVRFDSIDAPENDQPWGSEARAALASRLDQQVVALDVREQDRYGRLVAAVYLDDENINGWMVQQGNAWAYRHYLSDPHYCAWEGVARAERRGLWALAPARRHAPWEWRQVERGEAVRFSDYSNQTVAQCISSARRDGRSTHPGGAPITRTVLPATPAECLIKGNVSDNGRIYHVPGSRDYEQTRIDTAKGERWFCTEQEAQAAGWRAPKR